MPTTKELIEAFHARFKNTTLLLTFYVEDHDLLDAYDGRDRRRVERADIDRVCGEYLQLLWYPGKPYHAEKYDALNEQQQEARDTALLAAFDAFYAADKANQEEAVALLDDHSPGCPARVHRKAFQDAAPAAFPVLYRTDRHGTRRETWVYGMAYFADNVAPLLAEEDKAKRLGRYKGFVNAATNWGDSSGPAHIETAKENRKREGEEQRTKLEESARKIAARHKVKFGTMAFIAALFRERDRHRVRREGLREDGLCATAYPGSMAGVEQWHEMNDDVNGDIAHVHEVIDWLKTECPLLWAKYQERKLRRREASK